MSDDAPSYKVGYCRPPREHQFKKGHRPSPRAGRPRKKPKRVTTVDRSLLEEARAEANRLICFDDEGKQSLMTVRQALVRRLSNDALNGEKASTAALVKLLTAADSEHDRNRLELAKEVDEYKRGWEKEFAACDRRRQPRPKVVPHPDDIVLDPSTGEVTFAGPLNEAEDEKLALAVADRDRAVSELEKARVEENGSDADQERALTIARILDGRLPPRLRKSL